MKVVLCAAVLIIGAGMAHAQCPEGFVLNVGLQKCETAAACLPGFKLHPENDVCFEASADGKCPAGSSYNKKEKTCESSIVCPPHAEFNQEIDKCVEK